MPVAQKLNPLRPITGLDGLTITDFWVWAYSDILSNSNRSVFAEFMVGSALNVLETPRIEWDGVDFRYGSKKVEVKAAAYLQSWAQTKLSTINFDIGMKKAWDSTTNIYALEPLRTADCYVFCLYDETDPAQATEHLLNVEYWKFFVLPTEKIDLAFGNQAQVTLSRLRAICEPVNYASLKSQIDSALGI